VPDVFAAAGPHPDALAVHAAVAGLGDMTVRIPDGWEPLVDLVGPGGLREAEAASATVRGIGRVVVTDADGDRIWREGLVALVRRYAVLGSRPDWRAELPERRVMVGANGKPKWFRRTSVWSGAVDDAGNAIAEMGCWHEIEVDGFDGKQQRPYPDAYSKELLEPDPALAVEERAEWEAWRAAVAWLAEQLNGVGEDGLPLLVAHRLEPFCESSRPWIDGERGVPVRVLPDLRMAWAASASSASAKRRWKP